MLRSPLKLLSFVLLLAWCRAAAAGLTLSDPAYVANLTPATTASASLTWTNFSPGPGLSWGNETFESGAFMVHAWGALDVDLEEWVVTNKAIPSGVSIYAFFVSIEVTNLVGSGSIWMEWDIKDDEGNTLDSGTSWPSVEEPLEWTDVIGTTFSPETGALFPRLQSVEWQPNIPGDSCNLAIRFKLYPP